MSIYFFWASFPHYKTSGLDQTSKVLSIFNILSLFFNSSKYLSEEPDDKSTVDTNIFEILFIIFDLYVR